MPRGLAPFVAVLLGKAKARLAFQPVVLFDLGRVLASLEVEELVDGVVEQAGDVAVKRAEEGVVLGLALALAITELPEQRSAVELPADLAEVGLFLAH